MIASDDRLAMIIRLILYVARECLRAEWQRWFPPPPPPEPTHRFVCDFAPPTEAQRVALAAEIARLQREFQAGAGEWWTLRPWGFRGRSRAGRRRPYRWIRGRHHRTTSLAGTSPAALRTRNGT